jgi:iron complex outermembrane receptor protein
MVFFRMLKCLAALLLFAAAGTAAAAEVGLLDRAKKMVVEGKAECVVIRGGRLFSWNGRGVSPLLEFHDHREPGFLRGATVVDKVIGRAAAAIIVSGGAARVHGEIMSEDGKAYLESRGIQVTYGTLVPRILNMDKSDLCPLEKAVEGIDDPEQALTALRKRIEELKAK